MYGTLCNITRSIKIIYSSCANSNNKKGTCGTFLFNSIDVKVRIIKLSNVRKTCKQKRNFKKKERIRTDPEH